MMIALRSGYHGESLQMRQDWFFGHGAYGSGLQRAGRAGNVGNFQVFTDTIVMCTITALCILCSGAMTTGKDGGALSTAAFHTVFGVFGDGVISVSITLFAFATMLGWSHYGQCGLRYLCGR